MVRQGTTFSGAPALDHHSESHQVQRYGLGRSAPGYSRMLGGVGVHGDLMSPEPDRALVLAGQHLAEAGPAGRRGADVGVGWAGDDGQHGFTARARIFEVVMHREQRRHWSWCLRRCRVVAVCLRVPWPLLDCASRPASAAPCSRGRGGCSAARGGADRSQTSADAGAAIALCGRAGPTNREGPSGPSMLFYERDLWSAGESSAEPSSAAVSPGPGSTSTSRERRISPQAAQWGSTWVICPQVRWR